MLSGHNKMDDGISRSNGVMLSIIIPTYNESTNIIDLIRSIEDNVKNDAEVIVVDDNSPDGTADIVKSYADSNSSHLNIKVVRRDGKTGLISAILDGIKTSNGKNIVVMDADLSHPAELIPVMLKGLNDDDYDLIIASRYVKGGSTLNWNIKRKMMSRIANNMARLLLGLSIMDAVSGFFACKRYILEGIEFNTSGYKILLEILVKARDIKVKEIPYTFINRSKGKSKLDKHVILDYLKALWTLYRYGRKMNKHERRSSVLFLSRAARFYTVGSIGLVVNYTLASMARLMINDSSVATLIGIISSITSNFLLNKAWTFEDTNFSFIYTLKQYGYYLSLSSIGGGMQFTLTYLLYNIHGVGYEMALFTAIVLASAWNFLTNKKWTFKDRVWG